VLICTYCADPRRRCSATGLAGAFFAPAAAAEGLNGRIALEIGSFPNTAIISMAPDGTDRMTLAKASTQSGAPSWSPGGRRIVFVSRRGHRFGKRSSS
jgi:hypothetical protein